MSALVTRVAGAPITWGVCEVPGWGHQMSPQRVLSEMAGVGLRATELGPEGFLPADPGSLSALLERHQMQLVAGFVPLVLHEPARRTEQLARGEQSMRLLAGGGAEIVVVAAETGAGGYEVSAPLDRAGWQSLAESLAVLEDRAAFLDLGVAFHPHYGTLVESPEQVDRLLEASPVALCLDTGHLLVGGGDPAALARAIPERIAHVHLKDVDARTASRVRDGELSYQQAVKEGMYRPLGEGDVDVAAIIEVLEGTGYRGWYVLEQDTVLEQEPPPGRGPVEAARASRSFVARVPIGEGIPGSTGMGWRYSRQH